MCIWPIHGCAGCGQRVGFSVCSKIPYSRKTANLLALISCRIHGRRHRVGVIIPSWANLQALNLTVTVSCRSDRLHRSRSRDHETSPRPPTMDEPYKGLCAGGPHDGREFASTCRILKIPLLIRGAQGVGCGTYVYNDDARLWVWQGNWPPFTKA